MLNVGLQLRKTRKKFNLTLDQLASSSGVDRGTISRIELGHVSPRIDTIRFLCTAMGTSLSQFFGLPEPGLASGNEPGHLTTAQPAPGTHRAPTQGLVAQERRSPLDGLPKPAMEGYWPVPSSFWQGLLEVLERFEVLLKNSHEMIMVEDQDGNILYVSPPCEELLGFRPQDLLGQRLQTLIHPEDLAGWEACFEALLASPGATLSHEFRMRGKDDAWCLLSARYTNQLDNPNVRAVVVNAMKVMM